MFFLLPAVTAIARAKRIYKFDKRNFMNSDMKNELHKLVDNCDNELLLSEAKSLFESNKERLVG